MNQRVYTLEKARRTAGMLTRLRKDSSGNVLMLVAASLIPLTAMIGAGVDISRTYLVKSRLQQACDAGALAGRKFMAGGTFNTTAQTQAQNFFKNNFPTGAFGTSNIAFTPSVNAEGQITATAAARVPMTIMTVFGNTNTDLSVRCDAKLEISNTDVMFVLDLTGSMACSPSDSSTQCTNYINSGGGFIPSTGTYVEKSGSRAAGLREAVMDFFDELDGASAETAQLRFGFVPYSSGVNLGSTSMTGGILRPEWLVDNWAYQSRDANMRTTHYTGTTAAATVTTETYGGGTGITSTQCSDYGRNRYPSVGSNPVSSGTPPATVTTTSYTNNATSGFDWGWSGASDTSGTSKSCRRTKSVTNTTYVTDYGFTNWIYQQSSIDVSQFKLGNPITIATGSTGYVTNQGEYTLQALATASSSPTTTSYSWDGCIEERETVPQSTFATIPSDAYDLNIDLVPYNDDTRWRPAFPAMVYNRTSTADQVTTADNSQPSYNATTYSCPIRSRKLGVLARSDVYNYVYNAAFKPHGATYHDVGMLWGGRLISPTGIFSSENALGPNGKPIDRHVVFMTDGDMAPNDTNYSTYGFEKLDQRVTGGTPNDTDMKARHNARFNAICQAIRAKNITVWVVAFSQTMTTELQNCADPGKAFYASDTATLRSKFQEIAARIAQLRLTK